MLWKARQEPAVATPRSTIALIEALRDAGVLDDATGRTLSQAYHEYLAMDHRLKLAAKPPLIDAASLKAERTAVQRVWRSVFAAD